MDYVELDMDDHQHIGKVLMYDKNRQLSVANNCTLDCSRHGPFPVFNISKLQSYHKYSLQGYAQVWQSGGYITREPLNDSIVCKVCPLGGLETCHMLLLDIQCWTL